MTGPPMRGNCSEFTTADGSIMSRDGSSERLMTALREYLSTPIEALLARHLTTSPEEAPLELFKCVATTVPAYQAFLPLSIHIRRFLADRPEAARALFGESRLPTLAQYDPISRFFESTPEGLLFSGDNGIPLVRYNILDTGGLISYDDLLAFLARWGYDPLPELRRAGLRGVRPLPFVYVFGRSNFTISYFGANIYPENISVGLEQPHVKDWVTGKFVLHVAEDDDRNSRLSVTVELLPGVEPSETQREAIAESILAQLLRLDR